MIDRSPISEPPDDDEEETSLERLFYGAAFTLCVIGAIILKCCGSGTNP